jgi:hypothetical protein
MSYESLKLAANPALYWRLDMVGVAADGDVVPDISGNSMDGELRLLPGVPPYGLTSPIESDASSKAILIQNTPLDGTQSFVERDSDPVIEVTDDFTLEGWFAVSIGTVANAAALVYKRASFGGDRCFTIRVDTAGRFVGEIRDSANATWTVATPQSLTYDQWYYVVLVRLGNALAIYVDGTLRATATITSGLPTLNEPGKFQLAGQISGDYQYRADEVALTLSGLSGATIFAQYEAAFNTLNMFGQCDIRTSAVIRASDEPDPVAYPFRHNWEQPVVERLRWKSSVFKPIDGATELRRQRSAPRRQVEYRHLLYNEQLSRRFTARAFGGRTSIVQFEPDKVRVGDLLAGATSASADFALMDFEVGQYAYVWADDDTYEVVTLSVVGDSGVEWEEPLTRNYTRPWLKPARVARIPQSQQMDGETDTVGVASTQYDYIESDEPLNPRRIIPYTPTLLYRDRDCWDLREWQGHDYSEIPAHEWVADRSQLDESTGVVATKTYRWGAEQVQPWNMNLQGRVMIAKYLGWLYERSGQASPFWFPTFRQDLKPLAVSGNVLQVEGHDYTNLYASADNRLDLAFVYFDNTYALRRILSANVDVDNDALELDAVVPTLANLRWLSFLRRVILTSDDLELAWETDNVVRVAFAVTDAPLDWEAGSPSPSPSPSLSTSRSPSPSGSASGSGSPSGSQSPSTSTSPSVSPSGSTSPSASTSPSSSASPST